MRRGALYILITTLAIFLISACAQPSRVDKNFGRSVKEARHNQILNPEAGTNLEPVTRLDGKAAQASTEKYLKTFEKPSEAPQPFAEMGTQVGKVKE